MQLALRLSGAIDASALRGAAAELLARHDNLPTAFVSTATGTPVQLVLDDVEPDWSVTDLSGLPDDERDALLAKTTATGRARRFDPSAPPLLRLSADRSVLVVTNHHLVLDGWSLPLIVQELFQLYATRTSGAPAPGRVWGAAERGVVRALRGHYVRTHGMDRAHTHLHRLLDAGRDPGQRGLSPASCPATAPGPARAHQPRRPHPARPAEVDPTMPILPAGSGT